MSVSVLNENGADVAKHCLAAVPAKRISIKCFLPSRSCLRLGGVYVLVLQNLASVTVYEDGLAQNLCLDHVQ
jgi:hypothetical protein